MRFILWLSVVLGVLWGGYWFVGSTAIKSGVSQWFANSADQGMTASNEGISFSGFPSRFDLTLTKPILTDPISGWTWKAPFAQILSMTWKPWHVIAILPQDQEIDGPGQRIAVRSSKMAASLRLQPSSDLTLEELVIEARDLVTHSDVGWQIGAKSAVLALARDESQPLGQHLGLEIAELRPDPELAHLLPDLGGVISIVHLDALVTLSAALDLHAVETSPVVTSLIVTDFQLNWGSLKFSATGRVDPGSDGAVHGQIDFRIHGWQQIPALLVALGLVRPEMGDSLTRGLEVLAKSGDDPTVLNLPLTFDEGWMTLGPVPLGPAPMLN